MKRKPLNKKQLDTLIKKGVERWTDKEFSQLYEYLFDVPYKQPNCSDLIPILERLEQRLDKTIEQS